MMAKEIATLALSLAELGQGVGDILEDSIPAVSRPNFAIKRFKSNFNTQSTFKNV